MIIALIAFGYLLGALAFWYLMNRHPDYCLASSREDDYPLLFILWPVAAPITLLAFTVSWLKEKADKNRMKNNE